ncbi:putative ADP-ribosylglycohydrolase [Pyronema domesticum]|nr:putative ADP-ribosylglycohydrolase [Pyronema domesticum]
MPIDGTPTPLTPAPVRIFTSLLCLAICDALGAPAEFQARGTFPLITTLQPNANFNLPPGCWTDDTSQALCIAESLLAGTWSLEDQAGRYVKWWKQGYLSVTGRCFDIGTATRKALGIWARSPDSLGAVTTPAEEDVLLTVAGKLGERQYQGNGSLMRVLPIALAFWKYPEEAGRLARESSRTTHPNEMCQEACEFYVRVICYILRHTEGQECHDLSFGKGDLLRMMRWWEWKDEELRRRLGDGKFVNKEEGEIKTTGWVLDTLEAALWVFFNTSSFEDGAIKVVNFGDDADTVAAIYGGLAGAWHAKEEGFWVGRVKEWRDGLVKREIVEGVAERLKATEFKPMAGYGNNILIE